MRHSFEEFVSFYSNQVFETFSNYYSTSEVLNSRFFSPFSDNEWWAGFTVPDPPSNQYLIYYYFIVLIIFVLYLFKRFLHLDELGGTPKVHMITTSDSCSPKTSSQRDKSNLYKSSEGTSDGVQSGSLDAYEKTDSTTMEKIMERCPLLRSVLVFLNSIL